ncbi:MAG: bacteriohemerythrin [Muricoprocola sp.]
MYAIFDDSLITGNKLIDGHHQELIDKINKLLTCCEAGGGKEEAVKMLDYLADYTDFHFKAEEKLQEEVGYPGITEHKKKHEEFKKTVAQLYDMLEKQNGPTDEFVAAVNENVTEWLYGHIKGFDCSVATYINLSNIPELM